MKKIAVTFTRCVQVGESTWRDKAITRIFNADQKIQDIFDWCDSIVSNWDISELTMTEIV